MLTVALLSLLLTVGGSRTTLIEAFGSYKFYGAPKSQIVKVASSTTINSENVVRMRRSSRCYFAAKNAKEDKSKDPTSPSGRERSGDEWYWVDEKSEKSFRIIFQDEDEDAESGSQPKRISSLRFKICGNPRPLQRHRTSKFRTYNPSVKYQKSFQDAFNKLVCDFGSQDLQYPFFDEDEYLVMAIVFRMKRPKNHFVNSKPGPGRLKAKSPPQLSSIRSDVDNLTKFILDSMNGVIYVDDRQVTSIHATKLLDNEDLCTGSIEVYVRSIDVDDVDAIVASSIAVVDPRGR